MLTFQISEDNAKVILMALNEASKDNHVAFLVCKPIYAAIEKALIPEEKTEDGDKRDDNIQPDEK